MDGIYFYWFSWIIWVVVTFFMNKTKKRTFISCWILLSITTSNVYVTVYQYDMSLTFVSILMGGFFLFSYIPRTTYHLFCAFTMMIGYSSILIWEGQAPIWLFMPRYILIPLIAILMVCLLAKGLYPRIAIILVGICSGELLYCHMLSDYYISKVIGEMVFFDTLLIILFGLICIEAIQTLKQNLVSIVQNYKRTHEKQTDIEVAK
ncbi:hypothetical protein GMD78_02420 [Ornithinibacillus sp. L9]|uniref:Uncharacterized protein n=1 Tax=Ornithinibacillus caprae TaxID=2678566 RepID=A0A6N8FEX5_9BACI|nr:hypothetical protein [Ornithinibacillus caprae]MUK87256.1 hypothetical protein [Ornithinibacillus caprae]